MAKYITKAQFGKLMHTQLFDNDEYLRLLAELAGIESRPTTEYNHYDENGDFIGSSVDTDLSELLEAAGVEVRMDARLERLHDGWAIRFPNGGDFAQHAGTYGTNDGFVEPAIGCEADYSPVSLREAEKLICENRERLMTPSCEGERGMEGE